MKLLCALLLCAALCAAYKGKMKGPDDDHSVGEGGRDPFENTLKRIAQLNVTLESGPAGFRAWTNKCTKINKMPTPRQFYRLFMRHNLPVVISAKAMSGMQLPTDASAYQSTEQFDAFVFPAGAALFDLTTPNVVSRKAVTEKKMRLQDFAASLNGKADANIVLDHVPIATEVQSIATNERPMRVNLCYSCTQSQDEPVLQTLGSAKLPDFTNFFEPEDRDIRYIHW
jgi:hypothetical protein